jgi:hypothetical protein
MSEPHGEGAVRVQDLVERDPDLLAHLVDQRIVVPVEPRELHGSREIAQPEEQRLPEGRQVAVVVRSLDMMRSFGHRHPCVERSGVVIGKPRNRMKGERRTLGGSPWHGCAGTEQRLRQLRSAAPSRRLPRLWSTLPAAP